jgi:hypothetical protein
VLLNKVSELLFGWWNWLGKNSSSVWILWRETIRETVAFSRISRVLYGKLLKLFFGSLYDWSCASDLTLSSSVGDFLESLIIDNSVYTF